MSTFSIANIITYKPGSEEPQNNSSTLNVREFSNRSPDPTESPSPKNHTIDDTVNNSDVDLLNPPDLDDAVNSEEPQQTQPVVHTNPLEEVSSYIQKGANLQNEHWNMSAQTQSELMEFITTGVYTGYPHHLTRMYEDFSDCPDIQEYLRDLFFDNIGSDLVFIAIMRLFDFNDMPFPQDEEELRSNQIFDRYKAEILSIDPFTQLRLSYDSHSDNIRIAVLQDPQVLSYIRSKLAEALSEVDDVRRLDDTLEEVEGKKAWEDDSFVTLPYDVEEHLNGYFGRSEVLHNFYPWRTQFLGTDLNSRLPEPPRSVQRAVSQLYLNLERFIDEFGYLSTAGSQEARCLTQR